MQTKVILLTEIISPYRIPVFNALAQGLTSPFRVIFLGQTEKRRHWKIYKENIKFNYEVSPGIMFQSKGEAPYFLNPALFYKLIKYSPDIIISGGYHHPSYLLAMLYAKLFKRRIILWCESNQYDQRSGSRFREAYKRWFTANCAGYIVPGKASFEYLILLGAAAKKVWVAPNAVDNDYFSKSSDEYRKDKQKIKQAKGYPDKLILYVGRMINEKGVFDLLKVFQILSREQSGLGLLLIGSGEAQGSYKDFCNENNLQNVFFKGFVHKEELPVYYALSDVFVLPAHSDPWGLVLNEAMACKLPVISSDAAGAALDLIVNGENGYTFKKGDIHQLAGCIRDLLNDEQERNRMGQNSFNIIKNYSPLKCAEGFIQAIKEI